MRHQSLTAIRRAELLSKTAESAIMSALHRTNRFKHMARLAIARVVGDLLRPMRWSGFNPMPMVGGQFMAGPRSLESLENRQLMSAGSITFAGGVLTVNGPSTVGSQVSVQPINSTTTWTANTGDGHLLTVAQSAVTSVVINGGTGADTIYADTDITVPVTINGNGGNDVVRGGGGLNTIILGDGNAWVLTRGTASYVKAGNGNVTLQGSNGNDTLIAGNGNNYLDGGNGNDSITTGSGNSTLMGEAGNDSLTGGSGNDVLNGGAGNDSIVAGTGADTVYPGAGTNTVVLTGTDTTVTPTDGGVNTVTNGSGTVIATPTASPTPTPTATSGGFQTTWTSYPGATGTAGAPTAVIQVQDPTVMTDTGVVVQAINSVVGAGSFIDANFQWNFGDATGPHNTLGGFNASHVYANPGTYTITLTVTNVNGQTATASAQVVVAPDTRRVIYVNNNGNDANNGLTTATAVKTVDRAEQLLGDNTEILFARGQTFDFDSSVSVTQDNVLIGAYGTGAQPLLNYTDPIGGSAFFWTFASTAQFTMEDVNLTTEMGVNFSSVATPPTGVTASGFDITVQRVTFSYIGYGVSGAGLPVGLNVFDSSSPNYNGLQSYLVWGQGTNLVVVGNSAANSIEQHSVRTWHVDYQLIADNNFSNFDGKGCIEVQTGSYAWVDGNTVTGGDIRVGPRGGSTELPSTVTAYAVIQDNVVNDSWIPVNPGSQHIMIRNNVIDTDLGVHAIAVTGQDSAGRQTEDVRIFNNTAIESQSYGTFLTVYGYVDGLQLANNLYVSPTMAVGSVGTADVYVSASDLTGFTLVTNNVWQTPASNNLWSNGGINFVYPTYASAGELTASAWNALPQVGTDYFASTALNYTTYAPSTSSVAATAGTVVAGVWDDMYGDARPTTGVWSAGAVQVV